MEIKVTKRTKLQEVNNDMCHNWYYLVNGKIINDEKTRQRRFKFVVWFDVEDVFENISEERDHYTKEDVNECLDMCIFCYVDMIRGYETEQCKDFFEACNDSIKHWNEISRYMY